MAARKTLFDRKFGDEFIKTVPAKPGVYEILDASGTVIYVGKAKHLRRRLQQYRNARRCKRHHKMRAILKGAAAIRLNACPSDLEALLLENRLIQQLRPRFNVAGAFSFLYPMLGLERRGQELFVVYTTSPHAFPTFKHYGSYRSRDITREAYFALVALLEYIGHREPHTRLRAFPRVRFSHLAGFRQIDDQWHALLTAFLRGDSKDFLEQAVMALVEKRSARQNAAEIQEFVDALVRFFKFEAKPLRKALGPHVHSISQEERDRLFLTSRHRPKAPKLRGAGVSPS